MNFTEILTMLLCKQWSEATKGLMPITHKEKRYMYINLLKFLPLVNILILLNTSILDIPSNRKINFNWFDIEHLESTVLIIASETQFWLDVLSLYSLQNWRVEYESLIYLDNENNLYVHVYKLYSYNNKLWVLSFVMNIWLG